jgi:hypothetical protein
MADLTRLIDLLVQAAIKGGSKFVEYVDAAILKVPELADDWANLRPVFLALQESGALTATITGALAGAIAAIIAGKGSIGKPGQGHHG